MHVGSKREKIGCDLTLGKINNDGREFINNRKQSYKKQNSPFTFYRVDNNAKIVISYIIKQCNVM